MRFLLRRLGFYALAACVAVTANFFIPRAMPGNPAELMMAKFPNLQPQAYKALQAEFGVGHAGSLAHQYFTYLGNILTGNFGTSTSEYPASVSSLVRETLPWTLVLVGTATVLSFLLGSLLGVLAAWRRGGWFERLIPSLAFFQAVPFFFLAFIIIDIFALHLHWFPATGGFGATLVPGWDLTFIRSALYHSLLPAFTIVITSMAAWMLQMRNMMITTVSEDYVLAAQAKGLSQLRIMMTYAARNAVLPNISGFALSLGFVVSGALVMEVVFSYPGIGFLLFNAVTSEDYPVEQAVFLLISFSLLIANLLADILYVVADPRTRGQGAAR